MLQYMMSQFLFIKVAVLMHEHVHSCLRLSIVNKMLFISLFYVYVYFIYNHYVLTMNPLPKPFLGFILLCAHKKLSLFMTILAK